MDTWQELNFDFSSALNNGNTSLVLFFNASQTSGTTSDTYYIDDLRWTNTINSYPLISDFESLNPSFPLLGNIQKVSNPYYSGINTSTNVGQYIDDGTSGWDNMEIDFGTTIDISSNPYFSLKLYTPSSIQVMAKLEGGAAVEVWSDFSSENTWEEFNFDFSGAISSSNTKLILFFNPGIESGTSSDTYYIDDLGWLSTLSNDEVNSMDSFTYSPNPTKDFLKIDSKTNINSIIIFDIYGKVLMSHRNINKKSFEFDLSILSSGTYFLKNIFGNRTETIKILKE